MEHATVVVSGTKIAQEISSSRSEVWRLIQQLRGLGVDVAGQPASGYRLRSVPDLLLPEVLRSLLRGTIFDAHLHHFYKIGSTNTAAMAAAAEGAPEGTVFLAEEQTAGRGRGANSWQSPRSTGIYCSAILRPALPPSDVLVLSLAAGLAVHAAIQQVDSRALPDLKWPNDVLIDGKKVCGILTEMNAEATRVRYLVVGHRHQRESGKLSERVARNFAAPRHGKRVVARGVGCGFVKITRPRVSESGGRSGCAGIDSAPLRREFFLGAGQRGSHRRERFGVRRNHGRTGCAWIFAGAEREGNADSVEWNGKRKVRAEIAGRAVSGHLDRD